jgi:hypothetical protein
MSKEREDPGPFRSKKYLCKLIFDKIAEEQRRDAERLDGSGPYRMKFTPSPRDKLKAYVEKMWDAWEIRGDGQLVGQLLNLKMISEEKAKEEYQEARLRRRLHKSKERLRCRSKKSVTKTSSG